MNSGRSEKSRRFLRLTAQAGGGEPSLSLGDLAALAAAYADESMARIGGEAREAALACRKGCCWCCYLPVEAGAAEVVYALEHAKRVLDEAAFDALRVRIRAAAARYPRKNTGPCSANPPCPFLADGACLVYAARPLACRGWNSRDANACENAWREGVDKVQVPVDSRIRGVYANAGEALNRALVRDGHGEPGHLVPALAALLDSDDF